MGRKVEFYALGGEGEVVRNRGTKGKRREKEGGERVKHNCKHTEWEDKTIGMRA